MCKKLISAFFLIISLVVLFASCKNESAESNADTVVENGMVFEIFDDQRNSYALVGIQDEFEELVIPSNVNGLPVVSIAHSAFYDNEDLKKVTIPESVVLIDDYAFNNCNALEEVIFSSRIKEIGLNAFFGCENLKEIKLPASLEVIEASAFSRCYSLEKIHVGANLKTVGQDAFLGCDSVNEIYITSLAAWCGIEFQSISANPISAAKKLFVAGAPVEDLVIEGVETIREYAFFRFEGIKSLVIGNGVELVSESAFSGCSSLESLTLSDSVKKLGTSAFNSCTSLEYVAVGRGVEHFSGLAFYNCASIKVLDIKDLSTWCNAFFYTDSTGTANPMIYADVLWINGNEVEEIVIPYGVEKISTLSFIGFKGERITIPSSLKIIEDTAFYQCDNLEELHFEGSYEALMSIYVGANNFGREIKISYIG